MQHVKRLTKPLPPRDGRPAVKSPTGPGPDVALILWLGRWGGVHSNNLISLSVTTNLYTYAYSTVGR
jgi:hypothetical protein